MHFEDDFDRFLRRRSVNVFYLFVYLRTQLGWLKVTKEFESKTVLTAFNNTIPQDNAGNHLTQLIVMTRLVLTRHQIKELIV